MAASSSLPKSNSFGSNASSSSSQQDLAVPDTAKPRTRPNLPPPPPADRLPPPKGRTQPPQKFKLLKKGRRKEGSGELEDDDWTLEGAERPVNGGPARESMEILRPVVQEPPGPYGSSMTSAPSREVREISKTRSLAKKTSQLFSRKDKERNGNGDADSYGSQNASQSSLALPSTSRQGSYSSNGSESSHSANSARYQFPTLNRPTSNTSKLSKKSTGAHARRPSQDSQTSWPAPRSIRSASGSTYDSPLDPVPPFSSRQPPANLSASVPTLSRNNLPVPAPAGTNASIPSRMSSWFSHLIPSSSSTAVGDSAGLEATSPPSPARKSTSAAASFLNSARQKAVDLGRQLLDSDATPDKCPDTIWVMGVGHPGWRPATPARSVESLPLDTSEHDSRRGSASSAGVSSPSQASLRPTAWPKRKDGQPPTSPPPGKGFGNIFNNSNLPLALPTDSPGKEVESPKRKAKQEKEIISWPDQFLDDFKSRVWCTYRSQYAPILTLPNSLLIPSPKAYYNAFGPPLDSTAPPGRKEEISPTLSTKPSSWGWSRSEERGLTTDAGWGCMLRTGQSMLANALINLHLGRGMPPFPLLRNADAADWRLSSSSPPRTIDSPADLKELESYAEYVRIMSWFLDDPSPLCPFSVHRMALIGKELGKEVGEWFGPSTAAGALKTLANSFPLCGLGVATATDSMIYRSDVYAASNLSNKGWRIPGESSKARRPSTNSKSSGQWGNKAVLILIGLRLGLDGFNPIYCDSIKALFTFPQSVGIAGGRPSSSYYFVGTQANSLFYLDPHFTRPAIPLEVPPASSSTPTSGDSKTPDEETARPPRPSLDMVDVDDLSESSIDSTAASRRAKRSSKAAKRLSAPGPKYTPPTSPPTTSRLSAAPDTPTTPLASSFRPPDVFDAPPTDTPATVRSPPTKLEIDPALAWYANAYPPAALRTFHCEKVKKMPYSGLDPSMLLGFLCRTEAEFEDFVERVNKLPQRIFTVQDEPPAWDEDDDAGLESVSEPDGEGSDGGEADAASEQSLETTTAPAAAREPPVGASPHRPTGTIRLVQPTPRKGEDDDNWDPEESLSLTERGGTPGSGPVIVEKPSMDMPKFAIPPPSAPNPSAPSVGASAGSEEEGVDKGRKERPGLVVLEGEPRTRLDSWVRPEKEGVAEAPNGSSLT